MNTTTTTVKEIKGIPMVYLSDGQGNYAYFYVNKWTEGRGFNLTIASSFGCWNAGWGSPGGGPTKFLREIADNFEYLTDKLVKNGKKSEKKLFKRMYDKFYMDFIDVWEKHFNS